jgi:hypothetical protein
MRDFAASEPRDAARSQIPEIFCHFCDLRASAESHAAPMRQKEQIVLVAFIARLAPGSLLLWALLSLWALAVGGSASAEERAVDLMGVWHVTVHYRDAASENPDTDRWDDKAWRFETRGSRLEWTEFPIVIFDDRSGRFEAHEGTRERRVLHFWEPSEAQLTEIRGVLLVNPRGAKSKGMRGSPKRGYKSFGGLRAESASVIGYSESWYVDGLPSMPVFTRDDTMGSGSTENIQGRTRYTTESVSRDGDTLSGDFVRDGARRGTFTMRRASDLVVIGSKQDRREQKKKRKEEP